MKSSKRSSKGIARQESKQPVNPSLKDGISENEQARCRKEAFWFIRNLSLLLKFYKNLPSQSIATANVLYQKFFSRQSYADHFYLIIAAACVLIVKRDDSYENADEDNICGYSYLLMHSGDGRPMMEVPSDWKDVLLWAERKVLDFLKYDTSVHLPHQIMIDNRYLARDSYVLSTCYRVLNDGLLTAAYLYFHPQYLAAGAIFAIESLYESIFAENWWENFGLTDDDVKVVGKHFSEGQRIKEEQFRSMMSLNDRMTDLQRTACEQYHQLAVARQEIERLTEERPAFMEKNIMLDDDYRAEVFWFLHYLSKLLKFNKFLPCQAFATATVVCQNFFLDNAHAEHDHLIIASACMIIVKKDDSPDNVDIDDVCNYSFLLIHVGDPMPKMEIPTRWKEKLISAEKLVFQSILEEHKIIDLPRKILDEKRSITLNPDTLKKCFDVLDDGLLTMAYIRYTPQYLAAGAVYAVEKLFNGDFFSNWWKEFGMTEDAVKAVGEHFCEGQRLKEKFPTMPSLKDRFESLQRMVYKQAQLLEESKLLIEELMTHLDH